MGRGRGEGKKLTVVSSNDDPGSGGEDSMPAYEMKGRAQKPVKNENEEDEVEKVEKEGMDPDAKRNQVSHSAVAETGKKRKRYPRIKEKTDENEGARSGNEDSVKPVGFRQMGSRRKSKPRRAAEAVVECK